MPIFEYRCTSCGKVFEELVFGDRDRKIPCPGCGTAATEKIPSVIGGNFNSRLIGARLRIDSMRERLACAASGRGCCPHAN